MKRVMIVGQPGSGKSTLARKLGALTFLPVYHMDHIHWTSGWIERAPRQKDALCAEVHARPEWIFEGGRSATFPQRLARADTLIWLDFPPTLRMVRVLRRTIRHYGRTRPDLPDGCPEQFNRAFLRYIWRTRQTHRAMLQRLYDSAPEEKSRVRLGSAAEVRAYLRDLSAALSVGNLGIPHRGESFSAG
ncbi:AAA family ATPase [Sulfitobacter sp. D35]|uniref:AAA family ATPase n=1 Tax=Sulfitobacter sp. D35 TaxID=3083252 RepID=UPI00296FCBF5|nr:AAA family ATPase [Sulfitobacter sp. D35]MDW4499003.1 AAA family ATPase [Sulfitobacter sp. D35]